MKAFDRKISLVWYSAVLSIYNLIVFNIPFFRYVLQNFSGSGTDTFLITASFALVMLFANFFACYLLVFLLRSAGKVIVAVANMVSAVSSFFVQVYSVILDDSMISNVLNTQYSEASGFISAKLVVFVLLFGLLPSYWIIRQRVNCGSWKRFGALSGVSIGAILVAIILNVNNFLWIGKHDTQIGGLLMPWSYTVNICRLESQRRSSGRDEIRISDAKLSDNGKTVVLLIIGESARKANFSLYGYERQTNPLLAAREGLTVLDANSCATYTTAAVKSILEPVDSQDLYEILPNYAFRNGADVIWRTSNWGEPPLHIDEVENIDRVREHSAALMGNMSADDLSYDGALLFGLRERIERSEKDKVLVILHTSISHGPCYSSRYPSRFRKFTPVCDDVEKAKAHLDYLVNSYDNGILYTDYFIDKAIDMLEGIKDRRSVLIFVSDHGESLGEDRMYMHGVPIAVAPACQYEIPFLVWTTPGMRGVKTFDSAIDQHYVFHSVMDALGYESEAIDRNLSIFE